MREVKCRVMRNGRLDARSEVVVSGILDTSTARGMAIWNLEKWAGGGDANLLAALAL